MPRAAVLMCLALVAGCTKQPSPTVFVDPALATLVPAETVMLAGVRMQQLASTPFWRDYIVRRRIDAVENFRKRTGLDPSKDLWEFLIASDAKNVVVLVRGKFSDMGMEPRLEREGATRFSYKGFTMIGDEQNAVLFLNPSTAAAGTANTLRRLVDNRNNVTGLPTLLDQRIRRIPSGNQIWFTAQTAGVLPFPAGSQTMGAMSNLARLLQSVQFATGAFDLRQQVEGKIDLEATDAQQADRLSGAIRGLVGFGRLSTKEQQRAMLSVYDGIHVTKEASVAHVAIGISYSTLEQAVSEMTVPGVR